jgi:hypothetical protein
MPCQRHPAKSEPASSSSLGAVVDSDKTRPSCGLLPRWSPSRCCDRRLAASRWRQMGRQRRRSVPVCGNAAARTMTCASHSRRATGQRRLVVRRSHRGFAGLVAPGALASNSCRRHREFSFWRGRSGDSALHRGRVHVGDDDRGRSTPDRGWRPPRRGRRGPCGGVLDLSGLLRHLGTPRRHRHPPVERQPLPQLGGHGPAPRDRGPRRRTRPAHPPGARWRGQRDRLDASHTVWPLAPSLTFTHPLPQDTAR